MTLGWKIWGIRLGHRRPAPSHSASPLQDSKGIRGEGVQASEVEGIMVTRIAALLFLLLLLALGRRG